MTNVNQIPEPGNFSLIFEMVEEAKAQDSQLVKDLELTAEAKETIALFNEYQDSLIQLSYTTYATT